MNKRMKLLALFAIPHALVMYFCLIMIFAGLAAPFMECFTVDADGKLYVGEGKTLCIYQGDQQIGQIDLRSDTYAVSVNSDGELLVAYLSSVCRMDRTGKLLEETDDLNGETYQQLRNNGSRITTPNGDEYRKVSALGWTRIIKNGTEEVYRISVLSFVVKMLIYLLGLSLFTNVPLLVYHLRKSK